MLTIEDKPLGTGVVADEIHPPPSLRDGAMPGLIDVPYSRIGIQRSSFLLSLLRSRGRKDGRAVVKFVLHGCTL